MRSMATEESVSTVGALARAALHRVAIRAVPNSDLK